MSVVLAYFPRGSPQLELKGRVPLRGGHILSNPPQGPARQDPEGQWPFNPVFARLTVLYYGWFSAPPPNGIEPWQRERDSGTRHGLGPHPGPPTSVLGLSVSSFAHQPASL